MGTAVDGDGLSSSLSMSMDLPPGHPGLYVQRDIMEMPHDAPGYVAPWNLEPAAKQRGASTKIGVLALQGAFREHVLHLQKCDVEAVEVKQPADLADLHGLVIPGGESTAMAL